MWLLLDLLGRVAFRRALPFFLERYSLFFTRARALCAYPFGHLCDRRRAHVPANAEGDLRLAQLFGDLLWNMGTALRLVPFGDL